MSNGDAETSIASANEDSLSSAPNSQYDSFYRSGLNEGGEFNDFSGNAFGDEVAAAGGLSPSVWFSTSRDNFSLVC